MCSFGFRLRYSILAFVFGHFAKAVDQEQGTPTAELLNAKVINRKMKSLLRQLKKRRIGEEGRTGRSIFVFGGRGRCEPSDKAMSYSIRGRSWTALKPMPVALEFAAVAPIRSGRCFL